MKTLGSLLGSAGRSEILRTLLYQPGAVGLREAARIAGVHPHTAELALAALVREGLVRRNKTAARTLYEFNAGHPAQPVLAGVFAAAAQGFIKAHSPLLNERARSLLPFIRQATRMVAQARGSRRVA